MAAKDISVRAKQFIYHLLADPARNQTNAAIKAGYNKSSAHVHANRLLKKDKVRDSIERGLAAQQARTEITADRILQELFRLGCADPRQAFDEEGQLLPIHKMPEDIRRCIASFEVEDITIGANKVGVLKKVRFWDKGRSLDTLASHLQLLVKKVQLSGPNGGPIQTAPAVPQEFLDALSKLSPEKLNKIIDALPD